MSDLTEVKAALQPFAEQADRHLPNGTARFSKAQCRAAAKALSALSRIEAGGVEGWQLVPKELTQGMLIAARDWSANKYGNPIGNAAAIGCWTTLLSAAPPPPASQPEKEGKRWRLSLPYWPQW